MISIPAGLERMILEGRAEYKTLSMAGFNEMIIPVPDKTYIVILGYEYLPFAPEVGNEPSTNRSQVEISYLVQYLNIYNGAAFFPFAHYLYYDVAVDNVQAQPEPLPQLVTYRMQRASYDHQHRNTYIVCKQDTAVYATKMNTEALTALFAAFPNNNPIIPVLGYGSFNGLYSLQNYVDAALGRLYPLGDKYTVPGLTTTPTRYSQAFSTFNAANPADGYIEISDFLGNDYEKARLNHITLHYVKVNTEAPPQLI